MSYRDAMEVSKTADALQAMIVDLLPPPAHLMNDTREATAINIMDALSDWVKALIQAETSDFVRTYSRD